MTQSFLGIFKHLSGSGVYRVWCHVVECIKNGNINSNI